MSSCSWVILLKGLGLQRPTAVRFDLEKVGFLNKVTYADLNVEAELLEAFEQSFFVAGHKGLQVGVDG